MEQYSIERPCPQDFKMYKIISVGGLWAEQFAIKDDQFYSENIREDKNHNFKNLYFFCKLEQGLFSRGEQVL